tara:strand:- start:393 stop:1166 length:774 start_codon:yes stop_codon:yes gene_type:complete
MRIVKYFFYDKDLMILVVCLIISNSLFFYSSSHQVNNIKSHLTDLVSIITYPKTWYKDLLATKKENETLSLEVVQLKLLNNILINNQYENDRLRQLLDFKDASPWSLIPANVTKTIAESVQLIIIDIGKKKHVSKNLPVIDLSGLIGKTHSVGERASQVQLITDKNFRVSIRIGQDRALGNFMPTLGNMGILQGVRKSVKVDKGDIAYTSGISDIYPQGIPVAKVVSVLDNINQDFKKIVVEILGDFNKLDYVYVIQ